MRINRLAIGVGLSILLQACSDHGVSSTDLEGRQLWESLGICDYIINQQRHCFCINAGRTVEIVVRADTMAAIIESDSLLPPVRSGPYMTIDSLFSFIDRSRAIPDVTVVVSYNRQYGYPERVFVDPLPEAVDDEVEYITSHFSPIR